jgi:hypothetical protein
LRRGCPYGGLLRVHRKSQGRGDNDRRDPLKSRGWKLPFHEASTPSSPGSSSPERIAASSRAAP